MLQNPSKYHTNPLSHFLALHNSQATHNGSATNSAGLILAPGGGVGGNTGGNMQTHHAAAAITVQSSYQQQQQQLHTHHTQQLQTNPKQSSATSHAQLIADAAHTSLDVGKSFTIAAILGLQKSAMENQQKDYNNAINLSLNSNGCSDEDIKERNILSNSNNNNNNNTIETINHNNNVKNFANNTFSSNGGGGGGFNCDSLVNRYLPPSSSGATTFNAQHHHHHSLQQQQEQVRANTFAAAAAVAAAAASAASGAPSALQSLQQLHQQHAQQATLSFQREKLKTEISKKNSLKNKRVRTIFTPEQLERLEAEFERQQYMVGPERLYLAHTLQLTEAQVKVWFQNRRIKWRKHHLEITQQRLALIRQSQIPAVVNGTPCVDTMPTIVNITTPSAASTTSSIEENDNEDENKQDVELQPLSGAASESDLSICNDSIDGDSLIDGGVVVEDT